MNILNNIEESLKSIRENLLRTTLTALIIAIGITALVGILTAIDGIQASVDDSFAGLGVNTFSIDERSGSGRRQQGRTEKSYPPIRFSDVREFKKRYDYPAKISVNTQVTGNAEVKRSSEKTNPNIRLYGTDESYIITEGYNIEWGRNFSSFDLEKGLNVAIIGYETYEALFDDNEDPIDKEISLYGNIFKVIGLMEKMGSVGGGGNADRKILIPLAKGRQLGSNRELDYRIDVLVSNTGTLEAAMGEATSLMRAVRQDPIGAELSFEIQEKKSLSDQLGEITGYLRIGGFAIGLITLLGASVALMNIMMVSVTERTREIGIRKALGASPKRIRQQFLIEAIVICQIGGIAGVLMGMGMGNVVATFMDVERFLVPWVWILSSLFICIGVGLFSGYYPAFKASRLDPIESLRYE
ncbi:putative ABC transport system permease protein [Catalinimonas alkaloidigena]|uniref:ABC transporter permease n=1 Tax=Catalinimonas alkaloidigena TaxID=1075417 RepID=UPI002406E997|nr:ABC transporter permease [Catalinimonas alkaloidigena]MDF9795804.1 putative ABC transport system permease protein [Catalinimonas alkaloidigena]